MAYRLPPLGSLRAFEAAARHLSFKHAAEELHVTPAAISQQIKGLEDYLGVRLFVRLTRALAITPQGEAMLPGIRAGFDCLAEAVGSTCSAEAGGLNGKFHPGALFQRFGAHQQLDAAPPLGAATVVNGFGGIFHQIDQHLLDQDGIGQHRR